MPNLADYHPSTNFDEYLWQLGRLLSELHGHVEYMKTNDGTGERMVLGQLLGNFCEFVNRPAKPTASPPSR
jgi:hypothetical protein